jgi:hypothetical protein
MQVAKVALLSSLLLVSTMVFAQEPPVFIDPERSMKKQEEAADEAEKVVAKGGAAANEVLALLCDKAAPVRDRVVKGLCKWSDEDLMKLAPGLKAKDGLLVEGLAEVYELKAVKAAAGELSKALESRRDEDSAIAILRALGQIGDSGVYGSVEKYFKKANPKMHRLRAEALRCLAFLDRGKGAKLLSEALSDKSEGARVMALISLPEFDKAAAVKAATEALRENSKIKDPDWRTRILYGALDAVRSCEPRKPLAAELKEMIGACIKALEGTKGREQFELGLCLRDLTGEKNLADDALAWKTWWEARKDAWTPPEKAKKGEEGEGGGSGSVVRFHGVPIVSLKLTFLQDVSGGMKNPVGGRSSKTEAKIDVSKTELNKVLGSLDEESSVNLVYFATSFFKLSPKPLPIKKFRAKLQAYNNEQKIVDKDGYGRSNLYDSIRFALAQDDIDTVYVLTEGGPSEGKYLDDERFVRHLERANAIYRVRVHTMLMSTSKTPRSFLTKVAEATGGNFYDLSEIKK